MNEWEKWLYLDAPCITTLHYKTYDLSDGAVDPWAMHLKMKPQLAVS